MSKDGSPYGKSFVIRMLVLLGLLAAAVGGFYYDQQVLLPGAEEKVREVLNLVNARTDDGGGIPQSQVQEAVGSWASRSTREHTQVAPEDIKSDPKKLESFKAKTYEIESYKFKRVLPFMPSQLVEIAYIDKAVVFSQSGDPITEEQLNSGFETKFTTVPKEDRIQPSAGGMGGTRRGNQNDDDDKKSDDDEDAETDDDDKKSDDKKDEDKN